VLCCGNGNVREEIMLCKKAAVAALMCCVFSVPAFAQNNAVKIGVLDDMSGPYAENTGPGDVAAVKFAIADFGGSVLGKPIEMVSADFQSKVDVGVSIAKRWYDDENVDMILGIPNSAIALALVKVAEEKNRILMPTAAATVGADRQVVRSQQHPLDLRHLRPDQDHRQRAGQAGRRQLVLHHGRLRLRSCRGIRRDRLHQVGGGTVVGLGAPSAQHPGLLVLRAAGRGVEGQGPDVRQWRRRHHQRRQAGGRVRPDEAGHAVSAPLAQFPDIHGSG
jgi:hypothetical protein